MARRALGPHGGSGSSRGPRRLGRGVMAALGLLLCLQVALHAAAQGDVGPDQTPDPARVVYLVVSDDLGEVRVFDRHHIDEGPEGEANGTATNGSAERSARSSTRTVAFPLDTRAVDLVVVDTSGRLLPFIVAQHQHDDGASAIVAVTHDTTSVELRYRYERVAIAGRGLDLRLPTLSMADGPAAEDDDGRNGDGDPALAAASNASVRVIIAHPPGTVIGAGDTPAATDSVTDSPSGRASTAEAAALLPVEWPLPRDASYAAFDVADAEGWDGVQVRHPDRVGNTPYVVIGAAIALMTAWALWAFRRIEIQLDVPGWKQKSMSMMDHLSELRSRLTKAALVLVIGGVFFFAFGFRWFASPDLAWLGGRSLLLPIPWPSVHENAAAQVFNWLAGLVVPDGVDLIVTRPLDAVVTQVGIAIGLAIMVTFPVLFYQLYAFVAPGLYKNERRAVRSSVPLVVVLFVAGASFGLFFMAPFMTRVLYGFAGTLGAVPLLEVTQLVSYAGAFVLLFGFAFQLPAVMALLTRIGLTTTATFVRYWRHAVVVILVVAGFLTDPTLISQFIVGVVLVLLYLLGLGMSRIVERRAQRVGTEPGRH